MNATTLNSIQVSQFNIGLATPEIALLVLVGAIMVGHLFWPREKQEGRLTVAALVALAITAGFVLPQTGIGSGAAGAKLVPQFAFTNMFVVDGMSTILKLAMLLSVAVMLIYSRAYLVTRKLYSGEFVCLVLFATLGMMVMVSANHFVTLYLGLELLALSSYALVALDRDSARSTEAAMKYFILGALASGLLLYGISMVYGATGTLDVSQVAKMVSASRANDPLLTFGIVFIVAGLAFKLGVVPFHMWVPDVYQGAPTAVTLFIGTAPKIAAFGFVIRILADALGGAVGDWQGMLVILAVASLAVGNIIAIAQTNLKRMLAYSTISHMGFLLLGILAGSNSGYAAGLFYVIAYVLMALAAFGMIMLLSRAGFEAEEIDDFRGLNQRSPFYALLMLFVIFSMAGIPPFIGFWAKLAVLEAAFAAGFTWLVVFAVVMSVVGAYYYLRIIRVMYFDAPTDTAPIEAPVDMRAVLTLNAFAIVVLGLFPSGLLSLCLSAIQRSI
jgi:NADH-quinone oxidoreductase subunit N